MSVSLGGFKFVGYKYVKPDGFDATDETQYKAELLKMHGCKLKAFMEANTASGSSWAFSQTSGDYSFGSYGNVIYSIGTLAGFNLVSFFHYGSDNAYYCIATFGSASIVSGLALTLNNYYKYYYSSMYQTDLTNDMSCSGIEEITPSNVNVLPEYGRLAFFSDNSYSSSGSGAINAISSDSVLYGYAIKGKTIISIKKQIVSGSGNFIFKIDCIDGMSLCSPSDSANIFCYICSTYSVVSSNISYFLNKGRVQILKGDGGRYESASSDVNSSKRQPTVYIMAPQKAVCLNGTDNTPYEGAFLTPGFIRTVDLINADGIIGKGQVNIDILAVNNITPSDNIAIRTPYVNGNYLCLTVDTYSGTVGNPNSMYSRIVYCGWDPSNPDINQDSAWPVYSE